MAATTFLRAPQQIIHQFETENRLLLSAISEIPDDADRTKSLEPIRQQLVELQTTYAEYLNTDPKLVETYNITARACDVKELVVLTDKTSLTVGPVLKIKTGFHGEAKPEQVLETRGNHTGAAHSFRQNKSEKPTAKFHNPFEAPTPTSPIVAAVIDTANTAEEIRALLAHIDTPSDQPGPADAPVEERQQTAASAASTPVEHAPTTASWTFKGLLWNVATFLPRKVAEGTVYIGTAVYNTIPSWSSQQKAQLKEGLHTKLAILESGKVPSQP